MSAYEQLLTISREFAATVKEAGEFLGMLEAAKLPPPEVSAVMAGTVRLQWGNGDERTTVVVGGSRRGLVECYTPEVMSRHLTLPAAIAWIAGRVAA